MRNWLKKITHPFLKYGTQLYFSKPRNYSYKGISVKVMPGVFPPHYTLSTKVLLDYIDTLNVKNQTLLELGCGSGIIALFAASKGAIVTASDINPIALDALKEASKKNNLGLKIVNSDVFDSIEKETFDYVIINPPYYPKTPENIKEKAWFCGENFEYFKTLFKQLYLRYDKHVIMVLSEDCNIEKIGSISRSYKLRFKVLESKKIMGERNYIFKITRDDKV